MGYISNEGYINVVAVMQKFFDKMVVVIGLIIENYENNEVPVSIMAKDLLTTYKYGWKTSYYHNTMDGKVEDVVEEQPIMEDPFEGGEEDYTIFCDLKIEL